LASLFLQPERAHQAEVQHLDHVELIRSAAHEDVGGLDVAVDEARIVRLGQ
jgi:hypothetical protein